MIKRVNEGNGLDYQDGSFQLLLLDRCHQVKLIYSLLRFIFFGYRKVWILRKICIIGLRLAKPPGRGS